MGANYNNLKPPNSRGLKKQIMERINVDGKWYVEEKSTQDFDITYSYEASSGIFDFSVVLKEVDDGKRFEIIYGTCGVEAYIDGRF